MSLPTNYTDAVLNATQNTRRKYNMITNGDGTVSFEDVTVYTTPGSTFGAADINNQNAQINEDGERLDAIEDLDEWTHSSFSFSDITTAPREDVYYSNDPSSATYRAELDRVLYGEEDLMLEFMKGTNESWGVFRFKGSPMGTSRYYARHTYCLCSHKGSASGTQYPNIMALFTFEIMYNNSTGAYTIKITPEYVGSAFANALSGSSLNLYIYHQKKYD